MTSRAQTTDTRLLRGQRTRERLLEAALRLFALRGREAVGTRELAAAAGTNVASIAFHFGNKEGLYRAVIESVAGELSWIYQMALGAAMAESQAFGEDAAQQLHRVMARLTGALLASNRSQWMSLLLQREFITPSDSFETIYGQAIEPTLDAIAALIARTTGRERGDLDNAVLAFSMFIMASAFSRNKHTFLRFANLSEYTPDSVAVIGRVVSEFASHGLERHA